MADVPGSTSQDDQAGQAAQSQFRQALIDAGVLYPTAVDELPVLPVASSKDVHRAHEIRERFQVAGLVEGMTDEHRREVHVLEVASTEGSDVPVDAVELRRLLGTIWFRSVLTRLSRNWRERLLETLITSAAVPDHHVRFGRKTARLRELSYEQLREIRAKTMLPDDVQADLDLLVTVGRFWGPEAVKRFQFVAPPERAGTSVMESLLGRFR